MNCGEYKIDIGCGYKKKEGFIGVDICSGEGIDNIRDIEKHGLPFCDNSAIELNADSVLEHFRDLIFVMNECWRVLKPQGVFKIMVPHWASEGAVKDPTHVRFFDKKTFSYFEKGIRQKQYGIKPWKVLSCERPENNGLILAILQPDKENEI